MQDTFGYTPRKHHYALAGLALFVAVGFMLISNTDNTKAGNIVLDQQQLLNNEVDFNQVNVNIDGEISLQNGNIGEWKGTDGLQQPIVPSYGEIASTYGPNDTLYMMSYVNGCRFMKYEFERATWEHVKTPPVACGNGASLMYNQVDSLYFLPAGDSQKFFKFNIATQEWSSLPDIPVPAGGGASATFVRSGSNRYVYALRGKSSTSFWRFNITSNTWEPRAPFDANRSVAWGIDLTWDGSGSIYAISNHNGGEFMRYSILGDNWTPLAQPDDIAHRRNKLFWANGFVYKYSLDWCCDAEAENYNMDRYNPSSDTWEARQSPPARQRRDFPPPGVFDGDDTFYTFSEGYELRLSFHSYSLSQDKWGGDFNFFETDGAMAHWEPWFDGAQTIYFIGGTAASSMDRVFRMDLVSGEVEQIGAQFSANNGIYGTYYNNALYTVPYFNGTAFRKFDLATNDFVELPAMPFTSNYGSDIVDGGDGYLYVTFGGRNNFYRFSEGGGWEARASMPRSIGEGGGIVRLGASIYVQSGNGQGEFLKYDIGSNSWSYMKKMPNGAIRHGGTMISDGSRYIYSIPGTRTIEENERLFRFDTVSDEWERMADLPSFTNVGASGFYDQNTDRLYVAPGAYMTQLWYWEPGANSFIQNGSWYSETLDLVQSQTWDALNATVSGGGSVTFYTRTSANGNIWSDWQVVTGSDIQSPQNRYIQIRADLQGDGTSTPVVSDIGVEYSQETTPPTLPSQLFAQSNKGEEDLTTGQTYEYQHPYFRWEGASDGVNGSGVKGYHVYFGTNSSADPAVDGSYQTSNEYVVSTPMTAGNIYYLRIKVEDNLGNISNAATFFSYRYFYISPPGSILTTTRNEFASGTNTGIDLNLDGSMRLTKQNAGVWDHGLVRATPQDTQAPAGEVVGEYLYLLRGSNSTTFWRYHLVSQTWETLTDAPEGVQYGSALTWDGNNYLYATRGNTNNDFYRYDIQNNLWDSLVNLPANVRQGTDITHIGNNKIAMLFSGVAEFYMFDTSTNEFTNKASPPDSVHDGLAGSGIWYDGEDSIYAYFGGSYWYNGYRNSLAVYSISDDSWRTLEKPPLNAHYMENNLVGDGHGGLYIFAQDDIYNGNANNMAARYDIETGVWDTLEDYYGVGARGTVTSDDNRYIYIIPEDGNSTRIITYDTYDERFTPKALRPSSWHRAPWDHDSSWDWRSENSTTSAYDGSEYLYVIGGDESSGHRFMQYSLEDRTTTYLPPPPFVGVGGDLEWFRGEVYYLPNLSSQAFYRFDANSQEWRIETELPATAYRAGAGSLINVDEQYLYGVRGNTNQLYRYDPEDSGGTWTRMADAPASFQRGSFAYDGGNFIYASRGQNTRSFYRYDIAGDNWQTLANIPENSNYGSASVYHDGKVYLGLGGYTTSFYVYDVSSDSWSSGPSTPEGFRWGASFIKVNENSAIFIPGDSGSTFWQFNFPDDDKAYKGLASHISQPMQIDGLFDYAGISAEVNIPDGTDIEFFTRTSDDSIVWDEWTIADEVKYYDGQMSAKVTSTPKRYTQVKVMLYSHDNLYTPQLDSYTLDYYFDIDPPFNPSAITVFSDDTKATSLNNNTWYNHANAVFDWPDPGEAGGATDGALGSRVKGYWVYLGTDPNAVPQTAGTFVEETEYSPGLSISQTYYLRIQTEDMTGNVDPNIYSPFIYKFDNTPPKNPPFITVTPSGFTSENNFTFAWPNGLDNHSGIDEYCYRTGAISGAFSVETCQDGQDLVDVPAAYTQGTNVFYLRTRDRAGNFATSDIEASFYYSTQPPSPVTNLEPIPPSSTQNLFTFTWDLPNYYAGDPDQLTYCYSINILPSQENTTCTDQRFLPAFKAATQQGTNTIYVVARDESGGVSWSNYASTNFIANTVSPGIPLNLVVTDTSDRTAERWALTATWDPPTFEGNGLAYYVVERSEDNHTFEEIGTVSNTAWVDMTVEPDTTYYYRVRASDDVDNRGGASSVVSKDARGRYVDPPRIVSQPNYEQSFDRADISWVTERPSTSFVYYGDSPTTLEQSKGSLELVNEHKVTITGLDPSSVYYFKVQSFDDERNYELSEAFSNIYTFRTTESARIYNVESSDVNLTSALLNWQTTVPTKVRIEYGPTPSYGLYKDFEDVGYATNHIVKLDELESGTRYHYRIVATTQYGSIITSDNYSIDTIPYPRISGVNFQPVEQPNGQGVKVSWSTNVPATTVLSYTGQGIDQEVAQSELVTEHEVLINDLAGSTEYTFNPGGRDAYGNIATSDSQKWTSGVDTTAPGIYDVSIDVTTSENWGNTRAQFIISWKTDEPATSMVRFGESNNEELAETTIDVEPKTSHVVVVSDLDLAKVYTVQPVSTDISGNESFGVELAAVSPDHERSALDIILNLLQRIF